MVKDSLLQFDRISPIVKKALLENGFSSLKDICGVSPSQLSQECGLPLQTALEIIRLARSLSIGDGPSDEEKNTLKNDGVSAYELLLKSRDSTRFILTMSEQVDKLLGGGIKLGQVTEICGMAGTGKSQFGMQLACSVQIPQIFGGLQGECIYLDTEGSLSLSRLKEIANAFLEKMSSVAQEKNNPEMISSCGSLSEESFLGSIYMYRLFSKTELLACIKTLSGFLQSHPTVRLVIIDSLAFHFRYSEDDGKARAKILAEVSQILISIARKFNVAVVIMNHLTSRGGSASTSEMTFALGDTWKYCCNLRLILRFSSVSKSRCAELVKSSYLELGTAPFCITTQGIRDVESEEFSFAVSSSANLVPSKRALD